MDLKLKRTSFVLLGLLCLHFLPSFGLIHDLRINDDRRGWFMIENFGFDVNGHYSITIRNFKVAGESLKEEEQALVGVLLKLTDTDSAAFIEEKPTEDDKECALKTSEDEHFRIELGTNETHHEFIIQDKDQEGFYNTYFINCLEKPISFEMILEQYNVDKNGNRNYLSAGNSPLPTLYGCFTVVYFILLIIWVMHFIRGKHSKTNRIHHLFTVFIVLKMMALLFRTIEQHYIKTTGSAAGWNVMYYIFTGLKGTMLFILIALIGSGWSFIKPFLSDKDKKIFLVVIPLQILDNIALVVTEEMAPGSQGWITWNNIFKLVDIICCGAILIPIIWSLKHLREASQIDGKAARNLRKLQLFRQFYIMAVSYIYFTRIIVYLVDATLPYRVIWLGSFFLELAALSFFTVTGYKFRPADDNPYFALELDDAGAPAH